MADELEEENRKLRWGLRVARRFMWHQLWCEYYTPSVGTQRDSEYMGPCSCDLYAGLERVNRILDNVGEHRG